MEDKEFDYIESDNLSIESLSDKQFFHYIDKEILKPFFNSKNTFAPLFRKIIKKELAIRMKIIERK